MANPKLEKAVRLGLQMANGKATMDEAVQEMLECLALVIDVGTGPSLPPKTQAEVPDADNNVPRGTPQSLYDLAPINGVAAGSQPAVRVYWDLQELQNKILSETPTELEIQITNAGDSVKIFRTIAQDTGAGAAPGVLLGYRPNDPNPKIPYPKVSFWVTDEKVDLIGVVDKLKKEAADMYKLRVMPQTRLVADRPIRFSVGGEVS